MTPRFAIAGVGCAALLLLACARPQQPALQDLSSKQNLSLYKIQSVRGTRDGDRLTAQALISDSSSMLTLDMQFAVGSPTKLQSGTWHFVRTGQSKGGEVSERSVTFLGGQDGPPSLGGSFDLLGNGGIARYRVIIPVTELKR
ncbi:MAG TPA: hypothetical protein VKX49_24815 [Bryobacteraceae bacterium]|nr:hypothetical protein [Bryobacteraceae bacterium]